MATIDVKDAAGATVAVEKPLIPGRAAAASSRPVVLSTEDKAALDALATGLPASLGQKTANNSTSVVLSSDGPFATNFGLQADAAQTDPTQSGSLIALIKGLFTGIALKSGTALIGKTGIDQTTPGTSNAVAPISGQNGVAAGAGAVGANVQRVTHASDDPAVVSLAAVLAKIIAAPSTEAKQDTGNTSLASIDTKITALHGYVDGLEALAGLLNGYVDGLETLVTSSNTRLDTIHTDLGTTLSGLITTLNGYVDQLEGYVDGLEGLITTLNAKDFATQTTLASVLAKLIAAPATEAKQDTLIAKDFATQTTLAAVLAKIIAAPATEAKQDNAITQETLTAAALGTTAGLKVVTDANGTIQQYLRGLVTFFANALGAGTAATATRTTLASDDPAVATLGTTAGAAVVTDVNGTIQQYQRGLVKRWSDALGSGTAAAALRVTLATDGPAVAALGTTTDAAVITDATGSIQQYLRGLVKRWADALGAGTAAAALRVTHASDDPAVATLGATTGAAVITDANGTVQQYLRGLIKQWIAGTLTFAPQTYGGPVTVNRPANATPYTAGDVVGGVITFTNMGPSGGNIIINTAALEIDVAAVPAGMTTFRLHIYNVTPPSAIADNGAWNGLASGDRASYLGYVDIGTPVALGSTLYVRADALGAEFKLLGTGLFGYLVTTAGFTPAGNSEVYVVTLNPVAL